MEQLRIVGHKAVRAALRDTETYSSDVQGDADVRDYRQLPLEVDPPRHHLFRSALSPMFVRSRIQELQPEFRRVAHQILDAFDECDGGDFVHDVALPYVIACLGVIYNRPQDVHEWLSWGPDVWTAEKQGRSGQKLHDYLDRSYLSSDSAQENDIWTFVRSLTIDGVPPTPSEFRGIGSVLLAGGRDTVVKLLSGTMWHLLNTPSDISALKTQEVELTTAIQEMLRALSPLPAMVRVPPDQQNLSDQERNPSEFVVVDFRSANLDEEVFPNPLNIDFRRTRIPHVAFGFGPHTCIGNHIAEIETQILFEEILKRIDAWSWAEAPEVRWIQYPEGLFPDRFEKLAIKVR